MAVETKPDVRPRFIDKEAMERILDEQYKLMGLEYDPTVTAEQARAAMRADGVRPEDNILSRGIIEMREE